MVLTLQSPDHLSVARLYVARQGAGDEEVRMAVLPRQTAFSADTDDYLFAVRGSELFRLKWLSRDNLEVDYPTSEVRRKLYLYGTVRVRYGQSTSCCEDLAAQP